MTVEEALKIAFVSVCADGSLINAERVAAMKRLEQMLQQVGCEGFDPAVEDGRLTTLCDLILDG